MKLQYIATVAAASLLSTSLIGFFPNNASASPLRGSTILVADGHEGACAGAKPCAGVDACAGAKPCAGNPCAGNPCAGS